MPPRLTPYQMAFAPIAEDRFPALRDGLASAGVDPRNREAFVLAREAVELLRDIGPEGSLGEGVEELVALTHAAYLHWVDGEAVVAIDRLALDLLVARPPDRRGAGSGRTYYLQLPAQRVWGEALTDGAPEPLDGWFLGASPAGLDVVAVFGLHAARTGFTVVQTAGHPPKALARADGSALFSPLLAGGVAAGLHQVLGAEELLELAWRCHSLLPESGAAPGQQRVSWV